MVGRAGRRPAHLTADAPDFLEFFAAQFWPLRRVGFLLTGDWDQAEELAQASTRAAPLTWIWTWQEWCNKGLPQASLRITPLACLSRAA